MLTRSWWPLVSTATVLGSVPGPSRSLSLCVAFACAAGHSCAVIMSHWYVRELAP